MTRNIDGDRESLWGGQTMEEIRKQHLCQTWFRDDNIVLVETRLGRNPASVGYTWERSDFLHGYFEPVPLSERTARQADHRADAANYAFRTPRVFF